MIEDLYLPQVEQFGIALKCRGAALAGGVSNERVDARVVVCPLGRAGAVVSHRIRIKRDIRFEERGVPGLCASTLSADSLALCSVVQPRDPHETGNVAVFGQDRYERCYPLRSLSPLFGGAMLNERRLAAGADAVATLAIGWYAERERAERAAGTLAQAWLVRAARRLVVQHLDEDLSLDRIARDLLVSRTRL